MKPNNRNLIAACAAISVFGLSFGMSYPLLSLILESRGVSAGMIGVNSAMGPLGILVFSGVIPVLTKRFGARRMVVLAALITAALMIGYRMFDTLEAWFVIRLLQGMSMSVLFTLSEVWIVSYAEKDNRARVVAIYASVLSASFGAGPLVIGWIGIDGWLPFQLGAIILLIGIIPLSLVRENEVAEPEEVPPSGILDFLPKAPMLLACVGVFAIFDAATISLLPVYGIRNGLDLQTSANILSALILGNIVLQFPIGWLADRYPKRLILSLCAAATAISLLLMPLVIGSSWIWPLLILTGATGYGIYTVSLADLGDRFSGNELVSGSSSFAVIWGGGALFGSITGGWAMLGMNSHGLPVYLAATYTMLAIGLIVRGRRIRKKMGLR